MYFWLFLFLTVLDGVELFSVYIDDLSAKLVKCKVGCSIDNLCMNHVMYVDDICLVVPSPAALQELIDTCYDFSVQSDLSFNSSKSYCMVFKPKSYKLSCPRLYMDNQLLKYTDDIKYLGFTFSSDQKDDIDLPRQLRLLYTKSNRLLRLFYHVLLMRRLHYFAVTVLVFIVLSYGPITRNQLTVSLGLPLIMYIVAY